MRRQIRTQRHSTESYRVCRARHVGLSPSMVTKEAAAGHVRRSCGGWRRLHWPLVHTASHTLPHLRSQQSAVSSQSSATTLQNSLRESHGAGEMAVGRTLAGEWQGREVVLCGLTTSVLLRPLLLALQPRSTPASLRAMLLPGSRLGRRRVGDKLLPASRGAAVSPQRAEDARWTVIPRADGALRGGPEPRAIEIAQHRSLHLLVAVGSKSNQPRQHLMR